MKRKIRKIKNLNSILSKKFYNPFYPIPPKKYIFIDVKSQTTSKTHKDPPSNSLSIFGINRKR